MVTDAGVGITLDGAVAVGGELRPAIDHLGMIADDGADGGFARAGVRGERMREGFTGLVGGGGQHGVVPVGQGQLGHVVTSGSDRGRGRDLERGS